MLDSRLSQEVELWIEFHYLLKEDAILGKASASLGKLQLGAYFASFATLAFWLGIAIDLRIAWLALPLWFATVVVLWWKMNQRRRDLLEPLQRLSEQTQQQISMAKEGLPSLTYNEEQEVKRLINVHKSRAGREVFQEELRQALEFEGLRKWCFIRELCEQFEISPP